MAVVAGGKVVSGAARTRMRQGISPFRSRQVVVAHFTSWVQLSDQALTIGCMTRSSLMEFFHHRPSSFSLLVYAAYTAGANDSNIGISDHPNLYRRSQLPSCSIIRCDDALPRRRSVWPPPLAPRARQYGGSFTSQEASGLKILTVMITCRSVAPVVGGGPIDNDLRMVHVETSRWTEMHRHSVPNSIFCIAVSRHPQVTIVILGLSPVADGNGRCPLLAPAASRRTSEKA